MFRVNKFNVRIRIFKIGRITLNKIMKINTAIRKLENDIGSRTDGIISDKIWMLSK